MTAAQTCPLCVDLDGTLVHRDLLVEALFGLLGERFGSSVKTPLGLTSGKASFKAKLARRPQLDVTTLPCNQQLLAWLRDRRGKSRRLFLATASPAKYARAVTEHVGLFDEVIAKEGTKNVAGTHKAEAPADRISRRKGLLPRGLSCGSSSFLASGVR